MTLAIPPDVLRRAAAVLRQAAADEREQRKRERDEAAQELGEARRLEKTCERILGDVGEGEPLA